MSPRIAIFASVVLVIVLISIIVISSRRSHPTAEPVLAIPSAAQTAPSSAPKTLDLAPPVATAPMQLPGADSSPANPPGTVPIPLAPPPAR